MPGNLWDQSAILLSNNAGARIGAGIADLGSSLAAGLQTAVGEHRKKKKEKEAEDAAVSWLKKNGAEMGLDITDEAELKTAVKAAGGGMQAVQLISGLEQQKQQRAMQDQQMQLTAAQLQEHTAASGLRQQRQTAARQAAGSGGAPDAVVSDYLKRSGDIQGAGGLAEAYGRLSVLQGKERAPYAVDFGDGLKGVVANGNFIADPRLRQKDPEPTTRALEVGGKKMTVGPGDKYFDEQGRPVNFAAERPPVAPDIFLKSEDPELYQAMRTEYLRYTQRGSTGKTAEPGASKTDTAETSATDSIVDVTTEEELAALPVGQRFRWHDGRIGKKIKK